MMTPATKFLDSQKSNTSSTNMNALLTMILGISARPNLAARKTKFLRPYLFITIKPTLLPLFR